MINRTLLFAAFALAAACAAAAQLEPARTTTGAGLGRLFFTPTERAQLDLARSQKKAPAEAAAPAAELPPLPQTVTYGGIVRRSDGKSMLWLNNQLVDEKEALSGLNLKGRVRPDGAVTLRVPQTGGSIDVKVGQSVELHTGRVGEVRRPAAEPPGPDLKTPGAEVKSPSAEAAAPPAESKAGADARAQPAAKPEADLPRKPDSPNPVGLKLDRGSRVLPPAEEQQIRSRTEPR